MTPKAPALPRGAQVVINVGFNGNNLVLQGAGAREGRCIDAFGNSIMSQTSACNAPAFFAAANALIAAGRLRIPQLGTGSDGKACETTESFSLIDQDQSDNVISEYLLNGNGQTAQNNAANKTAMGDAAVITNGSDDALLGHFIDPALGCKPFAVPDATSPNGTDSSQATNSLSALVRQRAPRALLPVNDPQLLVAGQFSIGKTNAFRMMNDQPLLPRSTDKNQNAAQYCQNMLNIQTARLQLDAATEAGFISPVPDVGNNLATFMGARLAGSFDNMGCGTFGLTNPVTVTADGNGVATAVSFSLTRQTATVPAGSDDKRIRSPGRLQPARAPRPARPPGERRRHVRREPKPQRGRWHHRRRYCACDGANEYARREPRWRHRGRGGAYRISRPSLRAGEPAASRGRCPR